jgi:Uma2 family endonuclease
MQLALSASGLPAKLILNPEQRVSDEEFWQYCVANPDVRLERTAEGEIVIVPPAGGEGSYRSGLAYLELGQWWTINRRGKLFDCSAAFRLPNGAILSPDAAWVSDERLAALSKKQRRKFLPLCPEFVIEVMSPSDRLAPAKAKMEEWIANGVQLGWLIDGDKQTVYVYQPGQPAEKRIGIARLAGTGPVAGFVLELDRIWAGL